MKLGRLGVLLVLVCGSLPAPGQPASAASEGSGGALSGVEVPDHASPLQADPTSIKNLEAADPGAGLSLVAPPAAGASGDASLSVPLALPPGRAGLAPQVGLSYSSSGGNGWVGLGWDLPVPQLAVETRWGVPRYDAAQETETYVLDGAQLAPVAHRGPPRPRAAERTFQLRTEGAFSRVVRHGDAPDAYWWEVTDKRGVRYSYGGDLTTGAVAQDAVLTATSLDASGQPRSCSGLDQAPVGDVFRWMLREVRDLHGNGIRYDYDFVCDYGVAQGGSVAGSQLYLSSINYTQRDGGPGPYTVRFLREPDRRSDVQIDARGGFKQVTAHRLARVEVRYGPDLVRAYDLAYEQGAFGASLLRSVTPRGADGGSLPAHVFDYHDATAGFAAPASVATGAQADGDHELGWTAGAAGAPGPLRDALRQFLADGQASALGGSVSDALGGHLYVGFGAGPSKASSAGGKVGFGSATSRSLLTLLDLDGDGLPDKVFTPGDGRVLFRLNTSRPGAPVTFGGVEEVPSLPSLGEESTLSHSSGLEAHLGGSVFVNHADALTTSEVYFSDVNGDGLVDLVDGARVLFNRLVDGQPTFAADSAGTPLPLAAAVPVDTGGLVDHAALREEQEDASPLLDTVRRWTAPFAGTVQITGEARLVADPSPERARYRSADGVRLAVQHNGSELWSARVAGDDHGPHAPAGVGAVQVAAGDRLYFRVGSVADGAFDRVAWDPQVRYLGSFQIPGLPPRYFPSPETPDANGLDAYGFGAERDFTLAGRPGIDVQLPAAGTVRLSGDLQKLAATTDDITVVVTKTDRDADPPTSVTVLSQSLAWDAVGAVPLARDVAVEADEELLLQVRVDSPIDLGALRWSPRLHYTAIDTPPSAPPQPVTGPDGRPLLQLSLPYDIEYYPVTNLRREQQRWVAPEDGVARVQTRLAPSGQGERGTLAFTVKRRSPSGEPARLAKRSLSVVRLPFTSQVRPTNTRVDVPVEGGDVLFFDVTARDPRTAEAVDRDAASVDVDFQPDDTASSPTVASVGAGVHTRPPAPPPRDQVTALDVFPHGYRGWGVAGYNANDGRATLPLDEARLVLPPPPADGACEPPAPPDDGDLLGSPCNGTQATAAPFAPQPAQGPLGSWRGPDDGTWAGPAEMSSSRTGGDQLQEVAPTGALPTTVPRLSRTSQTSVGGSAHAVSGSVSGVGPLAGSSWSDLDYLDLNGDRFPDVVGLDRAQYTRPTGVLDAQSSALPGLGQPLLTDSDAANVGLAGSANPATFRADSRGTVESSGRSAPRGNGSGAQMVQLGVAVGASLGVGSSRTQHELRDVNGDTLPDRLTVQGGVLHAGLNLGYGFAPAEPWGQGHLTDGASANADVRPGLSINTGDYGVAGGLSVGASVSETACGRLGFTDLPTSLEVDCEQPRSTLLDLTGDGLVDRVRPGRRAVDGVERDVLLVAAGTGAGFAPEIVWEGVLPDGLGTSTTTTLGAGLYFTVGIPLCLASCYLVVNPGADLSRTMARQTSALRDVNGDGQADHLASSTAGTMTVALNRLGPTDLLASVARPLGGRIGLDYRRDRTTSDQPHPRWLLTDVTVDDGHPGDGVDQQRSTYRYGGGRYDRREREFTGYREVVAELRDPADGSVYRSVTSRYRNDSIHTAGLLERQTLRDGAGRTFTDTEHTYLFRDVLTGVEGPVPDDSGSAVVFPQLVRTEDRFFEGGPVAGKTTSVTHAYDALGNMTRSLDAADDGPGDDLTTTVAYSSCTATHVVGVPVASRRSGSGVDERSTAEVDCATGDLLEVRQRLDDAHHAVHTMRYTAEGNLEEHTGPENARGQRYRLRYEYDEPTATHVTAITDSHGYRSTNEHDLRFGLVRHAVDVNGSATSSRYDEFGRRTAVIGPYEQGSGLATVRYGYHPDAAVPWALTEHLDRSRGTSDPIRTAVFVDGLGRVVQTKRDATVHTSPGRAPEDVMTVSGRVVLDLAGRSVARSYPVTEPLGRAGQFTTTVHDVAPTTFEHDVLDRSTRVRTPDGRQTRTSYGFGVDASGTPRFEAVEVDADGTVEHVHRDVGERVTSVEEPHAPPGQPPQVLVTSHSYDAAGRVRSIRDAKGAETSMTYDALGRRTRLVSPDGGETEWRYDLAGNTTAEITAELRATGQQITYEHDLTRLTAVRYPRFPGNDVTYSYGPPGAAHGRAGRISAVTDASGREELFYGELGETVRQTRTISSATQGASSSSPEVYTTEYVYDSFERLQRLTYPDGEVLTYRYDSGGRPASVRGSKAGHAYAYANAVEYDEFGERVYLEAGNGVRTTWTHDPQDRRIVGSRAGAAGQSAFQQLAYTYDAVGDVLTSRNSAPGSQQYGGGTSQSFTYDDLSRLIGATGTYASAPDKTDRYELALTYDTDHDVLTKRQTHVVTQPGGTPVVQQPTTYDHAYRYSGAQPHAPTSVGGRTYTYDRNGNQTGWTADSGGTRQTRVWDEEDRLRSVDVNGQTVRFTYDASGERVLKRGPLGEIAYVNPYFTVRNREVATKHVYAGTTRLAAKAVKQPKPGSTTTGAAPRERSTFFFHPDHVGSVNHVTDAGGAVHERSEYLPNGERWAHEIGGRQTSTQQYAGKEHDAETGLYYYGARYYDPRLSTFVSSDPLLTELTSDVAADPGILNGYAYALQDPVNVTDPDGRSPWRLHGSWLPPEVGFSKGTLHGTATASEVTLAWAAARNSDAVWLSYKYGKALELGSWDGEMAAALRFDPGARTLSASATIGRVSVGVVAGDDASDLAGARWDTGPGAARTPGVAAYFVFGKQGLLGPVGYGGGRSPSGLISEAGSVAPALAGRLLATVPDDPLAALAANEHDLATVSGAVDHLKGIARADELSLSTAFTLSAEEQRVDVYLNVPW